MNERLILGLTGLSGTGKTTISRHFASAHGVDVQEDSSILKQVAAELGVVLSTRQDYEAFFREQQHLRGMDWLSRMVLERPGNRVMQAGLRSKYDFENVKRHGGYILALVCPPELCIQRVDASNPKNPTTLEDYAAQVALEESGDQYGLRTQWCVEHADFTFDTSKLLEVTHSEVDAVFASLTK